MVDSKRKSAWRFANPFFYAGFAFRRAYSSGIAYNIGLMRQTGDLLRRAREEMPDDAPSIPEDDISALHGAFLLAMDNAGASPDDLRRIHAHITTTSLVLYALSMIFLVITGYSFSTDFGVVMGLPVFGIAFFVSSAGSFVRAWSLAFRAWQIERVQLGGLPAFTRSWDRWVPWYTSSHILARRITAFRRQYSATPASETATSILKHEASSHER